MVGPLDTQPPQGDKNMFTNVCGKPAAASALQHLGLELELPSSEDNVVVSLQQLRRPKDGTAQAPREQVATA
jgi:hypothetical protein